MWPFLPVLFSKDRNNYFKKNSFNRFHKGTFILLDLLFLKHTKKKKNEKKKKSLLSIRLPFTCPALQADNLFSSVPSSEQLTQLRISFLQDEVPF
jgi:hypothetical protein